MSIPREWKEWAMLITLTFSTFFKIVQQLQPEDEKGNILWQIGFFFNRLTLAADTWVWFLFEHINMIIFVLIMILPGPIRKIPGVVFLGIYVIDLVSFLMVYDDMFKNLPITWNISKILIFLTAIYVANINGKG